MDNQFELFQETLEKINEENEFHKQCINENYKKSQNIIREMRSLTDFATGKLCWFWDTNYETGKMIRPMIRPYHHSEFRDGKKKYYSSDIQGNVIGHGWKYCKYVTMSEIVGLIKL
jgi:hypothetical protein